MKTIYLINPPARRVFRDGYCSGRLKYGALWQPLEFVVQAGILSERFEVRVLDYVANPGLPPVNELAEPNGAIILMGATCWESDAEFLANFKRLFPRTRVLVSGDIPKFEPDAVRSLLADTDGILSDFSTHDTLRFFEGELDSLGGVVLADGRGEPYSKSAEVNHPPPPVDVMRAGRYRLPLIHPRGFYSLLASFGCPFGCTFCNTRLVRFKLRGVENFLADFESGIKAGFRNFYVRDATFGVDKAQRTGILEGMARHRIVFNCFTRTDLWDAESLKMLARAGCALVQFGVEAFSRETQERFGKRLDLDWVAEAVRLSHSFGMLVSMHIIATSDSEPFLKHPWRYFRPLAPDFLAITPLERRPGLSSDALPYPGNKGAIVRRARMAIAAYYMSLSPLVRIAKWKLRRILKLRVSRDST